MTDASRVLAGEAGLRAAYAAHGAELYRFALRSLGDRPLAEEAVQETFLRAWRAAHRFDPALASLRTWLFAIVRNVVVDLARARSARPPLAGALPTFDGDAAVEVVATDTDEFDRVLVTWQVEEALRHLSDDHRTVLVEVHVKGRPYAAVAAHLGLPEGTVKSRVYYGLRALRLALEELGWGDE